MASIGVVLLQLPILLALYSGLNRVIKDPHQLHDFAYPFLQDLSWMQQLGQNIHLFDESLFGVVDLTKSAIGAHGLYLPALVLVLGSVIIQFFQSRQLLPQAKDGRSLRSILRDAGAGKQTDQSEVNAAVGRSTLYFLPIMIFFFTVSLASALSLYWLVGGLVAFLQQSIILREDETEMEAIADEPTKNVKAIPEAEIVEQPKQASTKPKKKKANKTRKKRRK
jgi:membrane protein insertase Oxa1/YidC/SpoIIIJ